MPILNSELWRLMNLSVPANFNMELDCDKVKRTNFVKIIKEKRD